MLRSASRRQQAVSRAAGAKRKLTPYLGKIALIQGQLEAKNLAAGETVTDAA